MNLMFGTFPECGMRINQGRGICRGVLVSCAAPEYVNYTVWTCTQCSRTVSYDGCHKPETEEKE